jgi:hypothetical protein
MNTDPASLDNLRDLAVLPPVSWWPLAPGWWALLGVGLAVASVIAWHAWRRWRHNAYRRAALMELESATNAAAIAAIVKRTALVAYPRTDVAALCGAAWCRWLTETGGQQVPQSVADSLQEGVFSGHQSAGFDELMAFAVQWIERHRSQLSPTAGGDCLSESQAC